MKTVLVAGGAGFIGSNLCSKLLEKNYKIVCVDNFITGSRSNIKNLVTSKNFRLITHDVTKPLNISTKIDAIFHMASPASPNHHSKLSYHSLPMETMLVNTVGTLLLLKLAKKNRAKFLFASSSEVYGDPLVHPQKEDYYGNTSTTGPRSVYDEAKRFGETLVSYFVRSENLDARIARIFNTFGPGMLSEDGRMIISFINQALSNNPLTIYGDGQQTRSLCFIDDMVDGLTQLMFSPGARGEVVNLGATEEHTVLEYANLIKKLTNSKSRVDFSEALPQDDPLKRKPDIIKAFRLLKWSPKINLELGLLSTINYFKKISV